MRRITETSRKMRAQILGEGLIGLAVALAAVMYILHTINNEVNVPINDDWRTVELYVLLRTHHLSVSQLWHQWNENRMALPFAITLGVDYISNLDMRWLIDLGLAIQLFSAGIIWWIARRIKLPIALRLLLPFLALPLAAFEDYLWGFQLAWIAIYFFLVLGIAVTLRSKSPKTTLACIVICLAASITSLQGLLVWFPVAIMAVGQRWKKRDMLALAVAWACVTSLYFVDFSFSDGSSPGGLSFAFHHPQLVAEYVVRLFATLFDPTRTMVNGNITTAFQRISPYIAILVVIVAGVGAVYGLWVLVSSRRQRVRSSEEGITALAVGVALVVYALLFAGITAIGRVGYGSAQAEASRYTLYTPVLLMGIVVGMYGVKMSIGTRKSAGGTSSANGRKFELIPKKRSYLSAPLGVVSMICVVTVFVGIADSAWDSVIRNEREAALEVVKHFPTKPSAYKAYGRSISHVTLAPDIPTVEWLVPILRTLHTSQFPRHR